eukprot:11737952-Ditylum_brightwellii.AAC.1
MLRGMITHPFHVLLRGMLDHPLHDIDAEHDNLSIMLRGMITHPVHVLLREMPTPLSLGNDGRYNKMINMSRGMLTYLAHFNDQGRSMISEVVRCKTLHSLENTDIEVNNVFDHVLFDEKKALGKLSCVKQSKRVV